MVQIIKRGVVPEEQKYTNTCSHCGTVFSFKRCEANFHSDQRDGDLLSISCPVCTKLCYTNVTIGDGAFYR